MKIRIDNQVFTCKTSEEALALLAKARMLAETRPTRSPKITAPLAPNVVKEAIKSVESVYVTQEIKSLMGIDLSEEALVLLA